jgi:oligogalacturonide lyase
MAHHNYRLEPNVRFSPDKKLVIFTSNMFGPSYVFGVETEKSATAEVSSSAGNHQEQSKAPGPSPR